METRLHLHELDSDHEGLLRVRPVQLLGSVADLGEAGGQIHSRRAVLGQLPQGHQLGGGERVERRGLGLPNARPFRPASICKHTELIQPASSEQLRGLQGAPAGLHSQPASCQDEPLWEATIHPRVLQETAFHTCNWPQKHRSKLVNPLPNLLQGPGRAESHTHKSGTPPLAGPTPTWSICTARCTRARASL